MSDQGSTPPPPPPPGSGGGGYSAPPPPPPGSGGGDYGAPPPPPPGSGGGDYGNYGAPPPIGGPPGGARPDNKLVWSILVTLFCCLPFGIVAIVKSAEVNTKWNAGDVAGAQQSAADAGKWIKWSVIAGVIVALLYIVFVVLLGSLASSN